MPIVCILTNECMPDTIKIGVTDVLEQRVKQLDNSSVALPFQCYYAGEVDNASVIEKKLHEGLDDCRIRQNREFFNTTPEQAKSLLGIVEVMGGKNVTPTIDIGESPQDHEALKRARKNRERFNFQILGIDVGTSLEFRKDVTITCEVVDDTQVRFRDEVMSLSKSADIVLREMGYEWTSVRGTIWWCLNGETLHELRVRLE